MANGNAKKTLLLIFSLLFIFSLLWALWPFLKNPTSVTEAYQSAGVWAPLVFLILIAVAPTPGAIAGASGVAYFGQWQGMLLLYLGNVLAVLLTFGIVRYFGRPAIERFLEPGKLKATDKFLARHPILLWVVYALPIFPLEIITAVVALSKRPLKKFIIIPLLALPIDALVVTTIGAQLQARYSGVFEFLSTALVIVLGYAIVHFVYKWKRTEINAVGKKIGDTSVRFAQDIGKQGKQLAKDVNTAVRQVTKGKK